MPDPVDQDNDKPKKEGAVGRVKAWHKRWKRVASGAAWILAVIVVFMDSLPASHPGADMLVRFPQFFISICFGLLLIAAHKWNLRQHMRAWVIACVLCLLIGTGVFLKYTDMRESNTAVLDEKRYVIGELRTDQEGVELQQACAITNGGRPCDNQTLLDFCHGRVSEIWTQASINSVQRTAVLLYITSALFFMGAMVSMLHALRWTESDPDDAESDEEPDDEDDGAKEKKDDAADDDDDGDEDDKKSDLLTGLRRRLLK